ncbi:MAG: hypothetical protein LBI99_04190 [Propionibacteriaceae bacterium]|jgi:plasmid stability protein|nr:hypothetical protein [Propionibacteriaceae bacterium]
MPLLQVRDFPEDLHTKLKQASEADRRSIAQETIVLLRGALGLPEPSKARRAALLAQARKELPAQHKELPDAVALIREDRER